MENVTWPQVANRSYELETRVWRGAEVEPCSDIIVRQRVIHEKANHVDRPWIRDGQHPASSKVKEKTYPLLSTCSKLY